MYCCLIVSSVTMIPFLRHFKVFHVVSVTLLHRDWKAQQWTPAIISPAPAGSHRNPVHTVWAHSEAATQRHIHSLYLQCTSSDWSERVKHELTFSSWANWSSHSSSSSVWAASDSPAAAWQPGLTSAWTRTHRRATDVGLDVGMFLNAEYSTGKGGTVYVLGPISCRLIELTLASSR